MGEIESGTAAGVPYVLRPPRDHRPGAPVVVGWHLMDAPRTESAFAAALPLDGLDAWRLYLGLPMAGTRSLPEDEYLRLALADAVLHVYGPPTAQALDELPGTLAAVRDRHGIAAGPIGVLGGSHGAAVAGLVVAEGVAEVAAAVLVSPLTRLRPVIEANAVRYGVDYRWGPDSDAVAARMDLVARADELGHVPVRLVVGSADDDGAVLAPAATLAAALPAADLVTVEGMGHALAEEPGVDPAPQTPHAAEVDRHAVAWFRRHLGTEQDAGS